MSSQPGVHSKPYGVSDFFRVGHSSRHAAESDSERIISSSTLDIPAGLDGSSSKRKSTRIPFLGRTRKKSNQSAFSSTSSPEQDSSEAIMRRSYGLEMDSKDSSVAPSAFPLSLQKPQLQTAPKIASSSSSFGSKLAAHFTPSKQRRPPVPIIPTSTQSQDSSNMLSPPSASPRAASFDSVSSGASRSPTPRTIQPTITVSFSPDSVEEYRDLFTLPKRKPASGSQQQLGQPSVTHHDRDGDITPRSSPPLDQQMRTSDKSSDVHRKESEHGTSHPDDSTSRREDKSATVTRLPSRTSRQKPASTTSGSGIERHKSMSQKRESTFTGISGVRSSGSTPAQMYAATATRTPVPSAEKAASTPKSRLKVPSNGSEQRGLPPSMPLPAPPSKTLPPRASLPDLPDLPSQQSELKIATTNGVIPRPRANTIATSSYVRPVQPNTSSPPSPSSEAPKVSQPETLNIDVNTATREQLKETLLSLNKQYEELASYLLKVREDHIVEIASLEKKISVMEREASRKDKEIKGLTWLLVNNRNPPAVPPAASSSGASSRPPSMVESDRENRSSASSRVSFRRFQGADDSGAESHPTSGAESILGSGASGAESASVSSIRGKRFKRPFTLGEHSYNIYRTSTSSKGLSEASGARSTNESPVSTMPYSAKRSSLSPSPSSSASSLLPPSPSAAMSSLSAIPEAASSTLHPPRMSDERQNQSDSEDRRGSRTSNRFSASSVSSSTTAASSNYAANMKRSRPPSIAQVLEKTEQIPDMENVLEKLRPFGNSTAI